MLNVDHITVAAGRKGPVLLRDVSFTIRPGTFMAVLGPNGSGKSTLLKAIGGELPLRSGAVQWNNASIADIDLEAMARERAFLDQHSQVPFAFTAREVVMMGRYPYFSDRPSAVDEAAVDHALAMMHVDGYQHREMPTLSGGERQRAHIARVIAQLQNGSAQHTLLLLDEPLNDLDIKHQHALLAFARSHAEAGHCVVAVLHDVNLAAQYAHRIALLKKGHIIADGGVADVVTAPRLSDAFGLPASVTLHPFLNIPWVHFGDATPRATEHTTVQHVRGALVEL